MASLNQVGPQVMVCVGVQDFRSSSMEGSGSGNLESVESEGLGFRVQGLLLYVSSHALGITLTPSTERLGRCLPQWYEHQATSRASNSRKAGSLNHNLRSGIGSKTFSQGCNGSSGHHLAFVATHKAAKSKLRELRTPPNNTASGRARNPKGPTNSKQLL